MPCHASTHTYARNAKMSPSTANPLRKILENYAASGVFRSAVADMCEAFSGWRLAADAVSIESKLLGSYWEVPIRQTFRQAGALIFQTQGLKPQF